MDLICYLRDGWSPEIRPAPATRDWMDATPDSFAYRCLPLNIANAHGWEVLSPIAFEATWSGGAEKEAIKLRLPAGGDPPSRPVSLFGQGVLTFHINGLMRTPPGWNMWVGGSPNRPKDGIAPLTGIVETDWSPYSFTMNWRFTRPGHTVRFEVGEPICFFFPVQRAALASVTPRMRRLAEEPELQAHYVAWSQSRLEFNARMATVERGALPPAETWQKRYYRGEDMAGEPVVTDHFAKLRLRPFAPIDADATPFDPVAPVALATDTAGLGRAIGEVAAAWRDGRLDSEAGRMAVVQRLGALGLGASEAIEVLWAAIDTARAAG